MPKSSSGFKRIAHRGANTEVPENTIEAFATAIEKYQMDMVEMDIRLTQDEVPIIFHDETIDRMTDGKGPVSSFTLKELKTKDVGYHFDPGGKKIFPYRGKGIRIPTLAEVLEQFAETPLCLEMKGKDTRLPGKVAETIKKSPHRGPLYVGSFSSKLSQMIRRFSLPMVQGLLFQEEIVGLYLAFRMGVGFLPVPAKFASLPRRKNWLSLDDERWINFLHKKGIQVFYWTVNEIPDIEEMVRRGADGLISDYPERLNQVAGIANP